MKSESRQQELRDEAAGALAALHRSAATALARGRKSGTPVWSSKDGRIVDLTKKPSEDSMTYHSESKEPIVVHDKDENGS